MSRLTTASLDTKDKIFEFILLYQQAYPGQTPSYREIMDVLDIRSTRSVSQAVESLVKEGRVVATNQANRSGMVLRDTVLLCKKDAERLGLDWEMLRSVTEASRVKLHGYTRSSY